mgnify:CR=1 FL=1
MKNVLFVDCCIRREASNTRKLAKAFLSALPSDCAVTRLDLMAEDLSYFKDSYFDQREALLEENRRDHPRFRYAHQFAQADLIVIAAPFWDLSFPASLKIFIENVLVTGLVFAYGADSIPHTLCKMKRVVYLTTSGGYIGDMNTGEVYIRQLCKNFLGDPQVDVVSAEGLDIWGNDVEGILASAREKIDALF